MKLVIQKENLQDNIEHFLGRDGYFKIHDRHRDTDSFVRKMGRGRYPRLHMYVEDGNTEVALNLHLDQKEVSYKGSHMHNAEYDGEVVESEILRLKNILGGVIKDSFSGKSGNKNSVQQKQTQAKVGLVDVGVGAEGQLGKGVLDLEGDNSDEEKPWWRFW